MNLRERLVQKRANYARSVAQCDIAVLEAGRAVKDAKRGLQVAREAQAATRAGLQVVDETLADMAEAEKAAKPTV